MTRQTQEGLPELKIKGENDKAIAKITDKAEDYYKAVRVRLRAAGKEAVLKAELMDMMKAEKIKVYRDDDLIVELTSKEGVKVRNESEEEPGTAETTKLKRLGTKLAAVDQKQRDAGCV